MRSQFDVGGYGRTVSLFSKEGRSSIRSSVHSNWTNSYFIQDFIKVHSQSPHSGFHSDQNFIENFTCRMAGWDGYRGQAIRASRILLEIIRAVSGGITELDEREYISRAKPRLTTQVSEGSRLVS